MLTVNTQSTSTTVGSSGQTAESCTGPSNNARASANALSNVQDCREFIRSLWLANTEKKSDMPLPGTMSAPASGGVDVIKSIAVYNSLPSPTGTNPAAKTVIAQSCSTAPKWSRWHSTWWMNIWRETGSCWKRIWKMPSASQIAHIIYWRDWRWNYNTRTSWNTEMSAKIPWSWPITTSALLLSTRELWKMIIRWKWHLEFSHGSCRQSGNETWTRSQKLVDLHIGQTPKVCLQQLFQYPWPLYSGL